ncbi:MAG: zinc-ribbon domain-containing protein, partial [bacterium]
AFLLTVAGILVVLISIDHNLSPRYGTVSQTVASPSNPVCPNCGAPVKAGDRFCQNCGTKLE